MVFCFSLRSERNNCFLRFSWLLYPQRVELKECHILILSESRPNPNDFSGPLPPVCIVGWKCVPFGTFHGRDPACWRTLPWNVKCELKNTIPYNLWLCDIMPSPSPPSSLPSLPSPTVWQHLLCEFSASSSLFLSAFSRACSGAQVCPRGATRDITSLTG